jgi:hypothetical protein
MKQLPNNPAAEGDSVSKRQILLDPGNSPFRNRRIIKEIVG